MPAQRVNAALADRACLPLAGVSLLCRQGKEESVSARSSAAKIKTAQHAGLFSSARAVPAAKSAKPIGKQSFSARQESFQSFTSLMKNRINPASPNRYPTPRNLRCIDLSAASGGLNFLFSTILSFLQGFNFAKQQKTPGM